MENQKWLADFKKVGTLPVLALLVFFTLSLIIGGTGTGYAAPEALLLAGNYIQTSKLTAGDGAQDDQFGKTVAVSGDTVVVGTIEDDGKGAVYVFQRPSAGSWPATSSTHAKLTASDGVAGDDFGSSVAISGDTIVVGASGDGGDVGAAYVFVRPPSGTWVNATQTAKLAAATNSVVDSSFFGIAVGISGDTIVVGASQANSSQGAAYIFERPATGWTNMPETTKLAAGDGETGDLFGESVAVHSDTVIVGAPGDSTVSEDNLGSGYVFVEPALGWATGANPKTQLAKLEASDAAASDELGVAAAIDGDTIVLGAHNAGAGSAGKAYIFVRPSAGGWVDANESAQLVPSDGQNSDRFGSSVGISNDTVVVGSLMHDAVSVDNDDQGQAYLFVRPTAGWGTDTPSEEPIVPGDAQDDALFGVSVSISGGTVAAGAYRRDETNIDQGAAYVFQHKFCSKAGGNWDNPGTWVGGEVPASGNSLDACVSNGHIVTVDVGAAPALVPLDPLSVRRMLVNPTGTLDLAGFDFRVEDFITNNGTLKQTLAVNAANVDFLFIQNPGGDETKYLGAVVDSSSSGADLGIVTVSLRETFDWLSPTSHFQYCTSTGGASNAYAQRCFLIDAQPNPNLLADSAASTMLGLYAPKDKLGSIPEENLAIYHYSSGVWTKLPNETPPNCLVANHCFVQGVTDSFSGFLIGHEANEPTAVNLLAFGIAREFAIEVLFVLMCLLLLTVLVLRRRFR
jgi:hypothetical protein